jgi:hypothetical protein
MHTLIALATQGAGAAARRQSRRAVMPPFQPPVSGQPSDRATAAARCHLGPQRKRSRHCDAGKGRGHRPGASALAFESVVS